MGSQETDRLEEVGALAGGGWGGVRGEMGAWEGGGLEREALGWTGWAIRVGFGLGRRWTPIHADAE